MADLYARTLEKQTYIESVGFAYISMWECDDFKQQLSDNKEMKIL